MVPRWPLRRPRLARPSLSGTSSSPAPSRSSGRSRASFVRRTPQTGRWARTSGAAASRSHPVESRIGLKRGFGLTRVNLQTGRWARTSGAAASLSLYKILCCCKAVLWESIIFALPPPTCKAYLTLQYYCTIIAHHTPPLPTPLLYAIHLTILVMAISCKGQGAGRGRLTFPLGLYKIFVYFEAFVQESILLFANTPLVWAPHPPPASSSLLRDIVCQNPAVGM